MGDLPSHLLPCFLFFSCDFVLILTIAAFDREDKRRLFVGTLSASVDETALSEYFSKFGTVVDARIMKDRDSGGSRGFGFITFEDESSLLTVLENPRGHVLEGREMEVKKAEPKPM